VAGIVEFVDKLTVVPLAVTTPLPQVVLAFGVGAITTPPVKVSVSAAVRVAALPFALPSVMVSVETPGALMVAGLKALLSVTVVLTANVAVAAALLLPLLVCKALAGSVLR
jgi:hypothetical protein